MERSTKKPSNLFYVLLIVLIVQSFLVYCWTTHLSNKIHNKVNSYVDYVSQCKTLQENYTSWYTDVDNQIALLKENDKVLVDTINKIKDLGMATTKSMGITLKAVQDTNTDIEALNTRLNDLTVKHNELCKQLTKLDEDYRSFRRMVETSTPDVKTWEEVE